MLNADNNLHPNKYLFSMCNYLKLAAGPFKKFAPEHAVFQRDKA